MKELGSLHINLIERLREGYLRMNLSGGLDVKYNN